MTPTLLALVIKMREAQKKFEKTRQSGYLEVARKLEKEVDAELKKLPTPSPIDLFSPSQR